MKRNISTAMGKKSVAARIPLLLLSVACLVVMIGIGTLQRGVIVVLAQQPPRPGGGGGLPPRPPGGSLFNPMQKETLAPLEPCVSKPQDINLFVVSRQASELDGTDGGLQALDDALTVINTQLGGLHNGKKLGYKCERLRTGRENDGTFKAYLDEAQGDATTVAAVAFEGPLFEFLRANESTWGSAGGPLPVVGVLSADRVEFSPRIVSTLGSQETLMIGMTWAAATVLGAGDIGVLASAEGWPLETDYFLNELAPQFNFVVPMEAQIRVGLPFDPQLVLTQAVRANVSALFMLSPKSEYIANILSSIRSSTDPQVKKLFFIVPALSATDSAISFVGVPNAYLVSGHPPPSEEDFWAPLVGSNKRYGTAVEYLRVFNAHFVAHVLNKTIEQTRTSFFDSVFGPSYVPVQSLLLGPYVGNKTDYQTLSPCNDGAHRIWLVHGETGRVVDKTDLGMNQGSCSADASSISRPIRWGMVTALSGNPVVDTPFKDTVFGYYSLGKSDVQPDSFRNAAQQIGLAVADGALGLSRSPDQSYAVFLAPINSSLQVSKKEAGCSSVVSGGLMASLLCPLLTSSAGAKGLIENVGACADNEAPPLLVSPIPLTPFLLSDREVNANVIHFFPQLDQELHAIMHYISTLNAGAKVGIIAPQTLPQDQRAQLNQLVDNAAGHFGLPEPFYNFDVKVKEEIVPHTEVPGEFEESVRYAVLFGFANDDFDPDTLHQWMDYSASEGTVVFVTSSDLAVHWDLWKNRFADVGDRLMFSTYSVNWLARNGSVLPSYNRAFPGQNLTGDHPLTFASWLSATLISRSLRTINEIPPLFVDSAVAKQYLYEASVVMLEPGLPFGAFVENACNRGVRSIGIFSLSSLLARKSDPEFTEMLEACHPTFIPRPLPSSSQDQSIIVIAIVLGVCVVLFLVLLVVVVLVKRRGGRSQRGAVTDSTKPFAVIFTDIESSTSLWATVPEAMVSALDVHHEIIRREIEKHEGFEVKTIGDAFMIVCQHATDAFLLCEDIQKALLHFPWGPEIDAAYSRIAVRKRMETQITSGAFRMECAAGATPEEQSHPQQRIANPLSMEGCRSPGADSGSRGGVALEEPTTIESFVADEEEEPTTTTTPRTGGTSERGDETTAESNTGSSAGETVPVTPSLTFVPTESNLEEGTDKYADRSLWQGVRVRIGVNYGIGEVHLDPVTHSHDYYGTLVNAAARVESLAEGGQVLLSGDTVEALPAVLRNRCKSIGHRTLRGIHEPVEIFAAEMIPGRLFDNESADRGAGTEQEQLQQQATHDEAWFTAEEGVAELFQLEDGTMANQGSTGNPTPAVACEDNSAGGDSASQGGVSISRSQSKPNKQLSRADRILQEYRFLEDDINTSLSVLLIQLSVFRAEERSNYIRSLAKKWRLDISKEKDKDVVKLLALRFAQISYSAKAVEAAESLSGSFVSVGEDLNGSSSLTRPFRAHFKHMIKGKGGGGGSALHSPKGSPRVSPREGRLERRHSSLRRQPSPIPPLGGKRGSWLSGASRPRDNEGQSSPPRGAPTVRILTDPSQPRPQQPHADGSFVSNGSDAEPPTRLSTAESTGRQRRSGGAPFYSVGPTKNEEAQS